MNTASPTRQDKKTRRLYVGNLDYRMPIQMLEGLFAQFGMLEDVYLPAPQNEDPKASNRGFGFVTFTTDRAAETARLRLDGSSEPTFKRKLVVQPAKERDT